MRIWIVNHYALPPRYAGGTRHYNFAKQLIKKGHEVVIIAANYNHFTHDYMSTSAKNGEIDYQYDVPFLWIPTPKYRGNTLGRFWNMLVFSYRLQLKKYLSLQQAPDVIIGSSPHLFAALGAERLAQKLKKPFMLEVRDLWPESLVDLGRISHHHPLIKLMKYVEQYLYKRATKIISLLPSADQYLIRCGVNANNILWLPNFVDSDNVPNAFNAVDKSKFTFMYAGSHGLANDLDTVIAAAKILQDKGYADKIHICLVGEGPAKAQLQEKARAENITIVEFKNPVSKKEIYSVLNKADAYLMLLKDSPVFRFGISPNKLFDYLLMARPIIFGVDTPFNPIAACNAGLTIKPSDPENLADAMITLAHLPSEERQAMGERGRAFVMKQHHVTPLTDQLESALVEVV